MIKGKNIRTKHSKSLEVIQMGGFHSGANRITGNFSFATNSYLCENCLRIVTVGCSSISGNLIDPLD